MIDRVEIIRALQMNTAFRACHVGHVRLRIAAERLIGVY